MEKKINWFNFLLFPGAEILYPLLSFVCLFFFFFGVEEHITVLKKDGVKLLSVSYILVILGYILCSLWGVKQKWWHLRFVAIGTMIIFFSFFILQKYLCPFHFHAYIIAGTAIIMGLYCLNKLFKSDLIGKILWGLPLIVIGTYYISGTILLTLLSCIIALVTLALLDTNNKNCIKPVATIGIVTFYILTTSFYFPYNPLFLNRNIKSVFISYQPRITSLVVEQDNKYIILDGTPCPVNSPVNVKYKFDYFQKCLPNIPKSFIGFNSNKYKKFESQSLADLTIFPYPISLTDSCAYFTSDLSVYSLLDSLKTSNNKRDSLTALIFYDFIELYQNNDTITLKTLNDHQRALQSEIERITVDTLAFKRTNINPEKILKDFSRDISLGMLNALCTDLIINNDVNSALKVFSWQFYLTYFDSYIYRNFTTNFNIDIEWKTPYRNQHLYASCNSEDLKRDDTFDLWVKMMEICIAYTQLYITDKNQSIKDISTEKLYEIVKNMTEFKNNPLPLYKINKETILAYKEQVEEVQLYLSSYQSTTTIKQYAGVVQGALYQCVLNDYLPDYNSFFLNRFHQIAPLVPMYSESALAYKNMSELYNDRFKQDIAEIDTLQEEFKNVSTKFDEAIALQDSIQHQINRINEWIREASLPLSR